MSEARMCDRCGNMFSLLSDGWESGTVTKSYDDDKGNRKTKTLNVDSCAECSVMSAPVTTRKALPAPSPGQIQERYDRLTQGRHVNDTDENPFDTHVHTPQ